MGKKKYLVGLLILLLTFLLGSLSTSYATSFTEAELKNIIFNSLTNFGTKDVTNVKNMCDSIDLTTVANKTQEYDYVYIILPLNNRGGSITGNYYMWVFYSNYLGSSKPTPTTCFGLEYVTINFNGYSPNFNWTNFQRETRITQNGWDVDYWRFNDQELYQYGDGTGNMLLASGWHPSNIDEGFYNDNRFVFSYPNNSSFVTIQNDVEPTNYCWISSGYQVFLGTLIDSRYTSEIKYNWWKWNGSRYVYGNYITTYEYAKNGDIRNTYKNTIIENNEYVTRFYIDTYNHANDVLHIAITPQNGYNFGSYELYYYIYNNNTVVVNGSVIPTDTFTGDYQQEYNQQQQTNDIIDSSQQNTDEIKDTITDGSHVGNILDDNFSGDLAGKIGYQEIGKAYTLRFDTPIMTFIDAVINTLNDDTDVYWDYSMHGETPTRIYASDFTTPNGTLKTFLRLFMVFATLYVVYLHFKLIIEKINSGNAINVLHEADADMYFVKM